MRIIKRLPNQRLTNKVIYIVATAAKKLDKLDEIVSELHASRAKVFLFLTPNAQLYINLDIISRNKKKCTIINKFDWKKEILTFNAPKEDLILVCPCTFNSLNKIALGVCDNYPLSV